MSPRTAVIVALAIASVEAFTPSPSFGTTVVRSAPKTIVKESFGFDFAEDQKENTDPLLFGETQYKQYAGTLVENAFVNRQYPVLRRVRELDLLKLTAEYGILSKLEKNGIDLVTLEGLLPTVEKLGLLKFAANNQQSVVNFAAFLLVEGAPFALPLVAGALDVGPLAFFLPAALALGAEGYFIVSDAEVPLVGLPADVAAGLLLVPLAVIFGGVGTFLSSAKAKA